MRTQVAIIGAGPAGMMLAHLLRGEGVDCVVLERRSRDYVEGRVRAGLLEQVTVELMERMGLAGRLHREGLSHAAVNIAHEGSTLRIDFNDLTGGTNLTVYGQSEVMKDLFDAAPERGIKVLFEAQDVTPSGIETDRPSVSYVHGGEAHTLECDIVAGCDGFHGVSRGCIPASVLRSFEKVYPFGWLGVLADVPPCNDELIYANHERGFALASMRSHTRSRCYVQCSLDDDIEDWPDERFWDEFALRIGPEAASRLVRGPSIEKSIAPLRSFVAEPMRHGRLFLAGDAAHIVPPTGAKGMNLAATDVLMLSEAICGFYSTGRAEALDGYSARALARVWKAERFSWWLTNLTHRFPDAAPIERRFQVAELDYIKGSRAAQMVFAENYVGLPVS